jgi:ankyrin repeat protein
MVNGLWNSMLILSKAGVDEAERLFQSLMWAYEMFEEENSCEAIVDHLYDTSYSDYMRMVSGFTDAPISWASGEGLMAVVDLLIENDEDAIGFVYYTKYPPLTIAAKNGHLRIVERLLQEKHAIEKWAVIERRSGIPGRTALQIAAENGHLEIVERLFEENVNVNAPADKHHGRTALQAASGSGHIKIVEKLLRAKADANAPAAPYRGRTALQAAAEGGYLNIVERLLQAGAEVNAEPVRYHGRTALQAAVQGGHIAIIERLLEEKADVNALPAQKGGITALRAAIRGGHLEIVDRLLQEGVGVHAKEKGSRTALHVATAIWDLDIKHGLHFEIAKRLLQAGADVDSAPSWARSTLEDLKVAAMQK